MKKYSLYLRLSFLFLTGLFISCSEDTSSLDVDPISGVVIDTTGNAELFVYQFEQLQVTPTVQTDLPQEQLSYEWKVNLAPRDTVYQVIGEEKNLDFEMEFRPNASDENHQLVYTVTDEATGLEYIMSWPLVVLNNIGMGLVVAETEDGINSDISHIMAASVTRNYTGESVKYNIYSTLNESNIPGVIKQMKFYNIRGEDVIMTITDDAFYAINTLDYSLRGINDDLFYGNAGTYAPQALDGGPQSDVVVYNGKLTSTFMGASREWGLPFDSPGFVVPEVIAVNPYNYYPPVMLSYFDEENQTFVYQPSITQFGDKKMYATPNTGEVFDPTGLSNMVNVAADVSTTGEFLHLLKNTQTGEIGLYVFNGGVSNYPAIEPPAAQNFFDLSAAPGIENATEFAFLDNQKVLYYASGNTLYAVLYGGSTPVFEERYSAPAGEEITTLQVFQQANYPFDWMEDYIATNNRQLIMSTYDGGEGRVYVLPFINLGVGNIDTPNVTVFEGFDRITAITTQL